MSCVAEKNAITQSAASDAAKKKLKGRTNATAAIESAISSSIAIVQPRFVLKISTNGLQKGLMTQGR